MLETGLRKLEDILHIAGCLCLVLVAGLINLDILLRELPGLEHVSQHSFDDAFNNWA